MYSEFTHGYVVNLYEYPGNKRTQFFFSSIVNQSPHFKIVKGIPANDEKYDEKETATNLSSSGERILHLIPLHLSAHINIKRSRFLYLDSIISSR